VAATISPAAWHVERRPGWRWMIYSPRTPASTPLGGAVRRFPIGLCVVIWLLMALSLWATGVLAVLWLMG